MADHEQGQIIYTEKQSMQSDWFFSKRQVACGTDWFRLSGTHLVETAPIAKDEVNGTVDVAILKVMATPVIIQSILEPIEGSVVEGCPVTRDSQCHCLSQHCPWFRLWCCILQCTSTISLVTIQLILLNGVSRVATSISYGVLFQLWVGGLVHRLSQHGHWEN